MGTTFVDPSESTLYPTTHILRQLPPHNRRNSPYVYVSTTDFPITLLPPSSSLSYALPLLLLVHCFKPSIISKASILSLAFSLAYVFRSHCHFRFNFGRQWFSLTVSLVCCFLPRFRLPSLSLYFIHFIFAFTGFARVHLGRLCLLVFLSAFTGFALTTY